MTINYPLPSISIAYSLIRLCTSLPKGSAEKLLYLKISVGFQMSKDHPNNYALHMEYNVYGQKQAGQVWNKYLVNKLENNLKFK